MSERNEERRRDEASVLVEIAAQLLDSQWASDIEGDWPERMSRAFAAGLAHRDAERRRVMALRMRDAIDALRQRVAELTRELDAARYHWETWRATSKNNTEARHKVERARDGALDRAEAAEAQRDSLDERLTLMAGEWRDAVRERREAEAQRDALAGALRECGKIARLADSCQGDVARIIDVVHDALVALDGSDATTPDAERERRHNGIALTPDECSTIYSAYVSGALDDSGLADDAKAEFATLMGQMMDAAVGFDRDGGDGDA